MNSEETATANHALQRTAPVCHACCSPQSPPRSSHASPPLSLSLGSLGVATRVVFNDTFLPDLSNFMAAATYPVVAPRSGSRCPARQSVRSVAVQS